MFKLILVAACVVAALGDSITRDESLQVDTTGGRLQGETLSCGLFCSYISFRGIPYGAAPVGDRRFRAPLPHPGWSGTRDALAIGPHCPSGSMLAGSEMSEDCLSLNVFTPHMNGNLPVLVWIHGGSFSGGSSNDWIYGPDHIVDDGAMMVSINYRLAVLGFLSTEDNNATGNYGMKDIILALKWIRANIAAFGGDPDNVTIFGESAGGAAVHYLLLSPQAEGLFNRAISQSGSALNPWAFQTNPLDQAQMIARTLGLDYSSNADLVAKLKSVHYEDLVAANPGMTDYIMPRGLLPIPFVPTQDPPGVSAEEAFLPGRPIDLLRAGSFIRVPYITGYTSAESLFMVHEDTLIPGSFDEINSNPDLWVPADWNIPAGAPERSEIYNAIKNFYFGGAPISEENRHTYSIYNTDRMFHWGIDRTVRFHANQQSQDVYYYQFSFDGSLNLIKTLLMLSQWPGAVHADDIFYLFSVTGIPPPLLPTNDAITTRRRMVRMWTNFARNGNPTPLLDLVASTRWPTVSGNQEFLDIDTDMTTGSHLNGDSMAFWNNLEARYARY